jgi:hypothetical protein
MAASQLHYFMGEKKDESALEAIKLPGVSKGDE